MGYDLETVGQIVKIEKNVFFCPCFAVFLDGKKHWSPPCQVQVDRLVFKSVSVSSERFAFRRFTAKSRFFCFFLVVFLLLFFFLLLFSW